MATEILRPNGVGDQNPLTPVGAAANWDCCDEAGADDDTTYVYKTGSSFGNDYYALQDTALTTETIDSIDAWDRSEASGGAGTGDDSRTGVRLSAVTTWGPETQLTASYVDHEGAALARPGGGSWAVSDLNGLQVAASCRQNGANSSRITQVYVEVNNSAAVNAGRQAVGRGIGRGVARGAR